MDLIVNYDAIKAAFNSFGPYKPPGTDGIYPILIQKCINHISPYLIDIYRHSLREGNIPSRWLETKAVFIPKPGKDDYKEPKAYRPISLSSFFLKGLERLVNWYITDTTLQRNPFHTNLYSYRDGMSTENALHRVLYSVENALANKQIAIIVFLDISGAFSDATIPGMIRALNNKGIDNKVINWINYMLSNRTVIAELHGAKVGKKLNRGTPQGGVLSPTLWNCDINELLETLKDTCTDQHAYADDVADVGIGIDEQTIVDNLQRDMHAMERWASSHGLSFNAGKTKMLIFSRKRHVKKPDLFIHGNKIEYVESFKYLGVTIDAKLNFNAHFEDKIARATKTLMACRKLVGTKWGLKPYMMYWLYTSIIRPIVAYGAPILINSLDRGPIKSRLVRLQRLACSMILGAMNSTPTGGMEMIIGLNPLDLFLKERALHDSSRLIKYNHWRGRTGDTPWKNSHTQCIEKLRQNVKGLFGLTDSTDRTHRIKNDFRTEILGRDDLLMPKRRPKPLSENTINCFTDGSKSGSNSGAGFTIWSDTNLGNLQIALGEHATVFQADIIAISEAAQWLKTANVQGQTINFYIDSQSAIKALGSQVMRDIWGMKWRTD